MSNRSEERFLDAVAEGVCLLLGYAADVGSAEYRCLIADYRNGVSADDAAIALAARIERAERIRIGCGR